MRSIRILYFLSMFVTVIIATEKSENNFNKQEESEIIIFIHGSMQPAEWRLSDLIKVIKDKIENSIYLSAAEYLRKDPFFYEGQAMQQEGLHPIDLNGHNGASILATMCEKQYQWQGSQKKRLYYTFGWKGIVHVYTRYEEAKKLYYQLSTELKRLYTLGMSPKIKIVTYSHGGNVALNLAAVKDDDPALLAEYFEIDQLIMFATPVQRATDYLVGNSLFKKVYHFYSYNDDIQTLDFTCPKQFFSKRMFKKRKTFDLPNSLVQIRMRTTKSLHSNYKKFQKNKYDYGLLQNKKCRHTYHDPKHTEFWCFQWGSSTYRDFFTLAPLPVVAFYPSIIAVLEQHCPEWHTITFDYAPLYEGAIILNKKNKESIAVRMLTIEQLQSIYALGKASGRITLDVYEQREHLRDAMQKAEEDYNHEHPYHVSKHHVIRLAKLIGLNTISRIFG